MSIVDIVNLVELLTREAWKS